MCSLVIWAKDDMGGPLHPSKMAQRPQRGHVIDVVERDDFFWGHGAAEHIVVRLPGVSVKQVVALTMGRPETPYHYAQLKANTIDLDAFLKKCRLEKGHTTFMNLDRIFMRHGAVKKTMAPEKVAGEFISTDLSTLLSCRRTLVPIKKTGVL